MTTHTQYREQERRSCVGKKRFDTPVQAGELAEKLFQRTGVWADVYECRFCDGWHIGGSGLRPVDTSQGMTQSQQQTA